MDKVKFRKFEGVLIQDVVVVIHGDHTLTFRVQEIPDLRALLDALQRHADDKAPPPATISQFPPRPPSKPSEADSDAPAGTVPFRPKPRKPKRGAIWAAVRDYLASTRRAQSFNTIYRYIDVDDFADDVQDIRHALKVALGRRVSQGDLLRTPSGRYKLTAKGAATYSTDEGKRLA